MRFTIRDLLWLTVVVALGVAWWLDRSRQHAAWQSADSEYRKCAAAYRETATLMTQLVEELGKRGVEVYRVNGQTVIGPETAFRPIASDSVSGNEPSLEIELPTSSASAKNPPTE